MKSRPSPTQTPGSNKPRLSRAGKKIKAEIEEKFGFFPPFFDPALETPEILENIWRQTLSAYVNNPLPALFKEKLFAYLSRYCAVPYCIICHSCALRPLGMTAAEVLALLTEPAPATEVEIGKHRDVLASQSSTLEEWPAPGSALDESLMACSIFSFLNPAQAEDCRAQLRHLLGEEKYAYLMVFLGYVKTCHLWVEAHPELVYEADQRARDNLGPLLAEEPRLAEFFRDYRDLIARERQGRDDSAAINHLHELGTRLVKVSDLQDLLEEILNAAIALQNADFGNIQLYDRETGALKIVAQRGFKQDFFDYFDSVHEGQAACGLALQQRRRIIIEDVEIDPGFTPHRQIAASAGFRAVQSTPLFSRDGEPVGVLSTHFRRPHRPSEHDLRLTDLYFRLAAELIESKQAEMTMRESEGRFRNMADTAPVMIWTSGTDKLCTFFNKSWLDFTGRTMEEELGNGWAEGVHPEDYGRCLETYVASFEARESFKMEYRLRRYDGEYRWVLDQGIPQFSPNGDFLGYIGSCIDITERREVEQALRESESRFRQLAESLPQLVWTSRVDGPCDYISPQWVAYTGIPEDDQLGYGWLEQLHPDDCDQVIAAWNQAMAYDAPFDVEFRIRRKDGAYRWFKTRAVALRDTGGKIIKWFGSNTDIDDYKRAEQALRESEDRISGIINSAMDAVISVDDGQRVILFNEAAEKMFGYSAAEVIGRPISILIPERFRASHERHIHRFGMTGETDRMMGALGAISGSRRNGEEFPIEASISQIEIGAKKLFTVILRDITGRVRAESALRESQERLASILDTTIDGIVTVDDDQRIVLFNTAAEKIFRCSAAEAIGQSIDRFIPERFRQAHREQVRAFGVGERAQGVMGVRMVYGLRADGEEFPMEASISKVELGGRKLYTVIHRDVTESLQANERLVEQAALLDQSHEAIAVRDLDNRIRYWSRGAERLYGWTAEEAVGRPVQEIIYREDLSRLADATRIVVEKGEWNGELRHITKDGREVIVEGHWTLVRDAEGKPKTILAINTDITEKKRLQEQFLRAQRLESIGTLASGIAHDLNNILSPILMGTQMLQMRLQDEPSQRLLAVMQANAERGAEMIKQVLSFAKGIGGGRVTIQPKHLIREIIRVVEETFPKSLRITQRLSEGLWATSGDATQLQQVLMNLCVNARDAMPNGGELLIEAENQALDEIYAGMLRGAYAGNFVVVTVTDTGMGIPPEIIDRIFDPFFTTKEPGRGTGLGLATVQGIITSHGGFITVESKPGLGTKFKIHLPAHEAARRKETEEEYPEIPFGAGEMILVIDDEAAIREMTMATLERFGYRTLSADNGATALGIFARHEEEISVVITDMMMPLMDGPVTIRALQKLNPQVRIIASSGLAESMNDADLDRLGVKTFLTKPYDAKTLLKTVAHALS